MDYDVEAVTALTLVPTLRMGTTHVPLRGTRGGIHAHLFDATQHNERAAERRARGARAERGNE